MVGACPQCQPRSRPHCPDQPGLPGRRHHRWPRRGQVLLGPDRRGRTWPGYLGAPAAQRPPCRSKTPYGCLAFLLARLPQAYMGSPTAILRGITSLIRSDAAGRPLRHHPGHRRQHRRHERRRPPEHPPDRDRPDRRRRPQEQRPSGRLPLAAHRPPADRSQAGQPERAADPAGAAVPAGPPRFRVPGEHLPHHGGR